MRSTLSLRLPEELAEWLEETASKMGVSQGKLIRDELEKARISEARSFLRLAGKVSGDADLSKRKGFSRK